MKRYMAALFLSITLLAAGCSRGPEEAAFSRPEVTGLTVRAVQPSTVTEYYEASGTVEARTISRISSRVMGTVTSIRAREGARVKEGDLLLTIDDKDLRARVEASEEALNEARRALRSAEEQKALAEKTFERYRKLHEEKALSTQELDNMETKKNVVGYEYERMLASVSRAEAALREARVFLGYARVVSPVRGVVSQKLIDAGSTAAPGSPLFVVEDDSSYRIEVDVDERLLRSVSPGMAVDVLIPALGRSLAGSVSEVVPRVDPLSRTFRVKVELEEGSLRSGLYGKARFPVGTKEALAVPAGAVVRKGQLTGVYTVGSGGIITYRLVRTGKDYDGKVEVLSGLEPGDRVIVEGVALAVDGGVLAEAMAQK